MVKGLVWRRSGVKGRHLARAAGTGAWGAGSGTDALVPRRGREYRKAKGASASLC